MPQFHHSLPFGAELQRDASTRFRLWAPDAKRVDVVAPDARAIAALQPTAGGWFEGTAVAKAGTLYRFRIDDEVDVPDPAARFTPDGLLGPAEIIDANAFEWRHTTWEGLPWHRAVLYELHVGTFTPAGTYEAIIPRLAELAALGINTIELLPVATFPGVRGWGYDGVLPFAPHPSYGRPEDLKRLVDAAHAQGIALVLDVVYNHFGPEGNYLQRYSRDFFTERYKTPWGSAINFEGDSGRCVRDFFIQNALYWLNEYRFDGLRLDAVHAITDASKTHFVDELAAAIEAGPARERHIHLILENHDNQASRLTPARSSRLSKAQWNDDFHHIAHVLLTGESDGYYASYADAPATRLGRVLSEGFDYQGDPYGEAGEPRGEPSKRLAVTSFIDFLQNHDQIGNRACGDRLVTMTDDARLRAGLAILLLTPNVPMLFMGEEYGARQPFQYFCDYQGELAHAITKGRREEFAAFKAFATEEARASIPDPNDVKTFERSRLRWEDRDERSHREWLDYVRELLRIRAEHIVPRLPAIAPGSAQASVRDELIEVRWPLAEGGVQLHANLRDEDCNRFECKGRVLFSTAASPNDSRLAPWEVRLSIG